jgi:hypothetical protein
MMTFLILLAKLFVFGLLLFLLIGIINMALAISGRLFSGSRYLSLFYSIVVSIIFVYLYAFWGAYLKSTVTTYSSIYSKKWLLVILCYISIFPWMKFIGKQLKEEKAKMNTAVSQFYNSNANKEAYVQSITVIALSMNIILPISYTMFLFTDKLHDTLFYSWPTFLSKLFL